MPGPVVRFVDRDYVLVDGRKLLYLAGTDYHRLSAHAMTRSAMARSVESMGVGPTGSRATTGNHEVYGRLEEKIAQFFDVEAAVVLPGGYMSNIILLQAIADTFDTIFLDEKSHPSIVDAASMAAGTAGKKVFRYAHVSPQDLRTKMRKHLMAGSRPLIMTDGVFPFDGVMPPLRDYAEIIEDYDGKIVLDDAHAMAVTGRQGKGSWEEAGIGRDRIYQTGTLSKAFGAYGGIIPGSGELAWRIHQRSSAFAGCTGLPLPVAAAAIFTVSYLFSNRQKITALQKKATGLKARFRKLGLSMPDNPVPVFPVYFNDEDKNDRLKKLLIKNGIYPSFIKYPGAPADGMFRFIITSSTTDEQADLLFETVRSAVEKNG